ncbi:peptide ABC transporter substrate-binding protein [Caviibacterium pharyngocola]|uniref:Solute-binding protein family 5 domain-containing protein n=1 Tax=Caviibacterium pharyngocola TaxID=28159 RepID=A0A2M8RZ92_9PAST|nr:peptide ABC transporter substrate-binding protein [Caviibacterium pharyngocola]PJG84196.1 hypothetical protein CVP04_00350 [Caviibacterium pharyngocola]
MFNSSFTFPFLRKSAVIFGAIFMLNACDQKQNEPILPPNSPPEIAQTEPQETQAKRDLLIRGVYDDVVINPLMLQRESQTAFLRDILEGLVIYNPQGEIIPAVAESWQTEDNKNWVFILREEAKWSNGQAVTAQDFVKSWRQLALSNSPLKSYLLFLNLANAREVMTYQQPVEKLGVEALNERMLHIRLDKAVPYLPAMLAHPALLPQYFAEHEGFVTNGAYRILGQKDDLIHLAKNEFYRDNSAIFFNRVDYQKILPDQALGEIDLIENPSQPTLQTLHLPKLCSYYYEFNFKDPQLAKSAVRKALVSMISTRSLVQSEKPSMLASNQLLPQSMQPEAEGGWEPSVVEQLLQQSGISETAPLQLRLTFDQESFHSAMAQRLIQMWSQSDMIRIIAEPVSRQVLLEKRAAGDFQIIRSGWCADYNDPSAFLMNFYSAGPDNKSGYHNRELDQLLEKTLDTISAQNRTALYAQAARILQKDNVVLPIFQYTTPFYLAPSLSGVEPNNSGGVIYSKDLRRNETAKTSHR